MSFNYWRIMTASTPKMRDGKKVRSLCVECPLTGARKNVNQTLEEGEEFSDVVGTHLCFRPHLFCEEYGSGEWLRVSAMETYMALQKELNEQRSRVSRLHDDIEAEYQGFLTSRVAPDAGLG